MRAPVPYWVVALVALCGVGVDLAALWWLWEVYDSDSGPTGPQLLVVGAAALLAVVLLAMAAVIDHRRRH